MSLSAIWDRFWWSLMLGIFIGLLWLKFLDPIISCVSIGLLFSSSIGLAYFAIGIRKMLMEKKREEEIERKAFEELMAELHEEGVK